MARRMRNDEGERAIQRDPESFGRFKCAPERPRSGLDEAWRLIRQGRFSEAESFLNGVLDGKPGDKEALSALLQMYSRAEKYEGLERTVSYAKENGLLDAKICTLAIRAFGKMGRLDDAVALFYGALEAGVGDPKMASAALEACDRCDSIEDAEDILKDARERGIADVMVFTKMIDLYDLFSEQDRALHLFREARSEGIKPDMHLYTVMVGACGRGGMLSEARKLFEEAVAAGQADSLTYTSMINTYMKRGKTKEAREIFQRARESGLVDRMMVRALDG